MKRVTFFALATTCLLNACNPSSDQATVSQDKATPAPRPNIVLIIGDDHGWPYYGFLGDEHVVTPNLDRLAAHGQLYTAAHVTANDCRPTLQTLVSGLYPTTYDQKATSYADAAVAEIEDYADMPPKERWAHRLYAETHFIRQIETLPRLLQMQGYKSLQTGKWWEQGYADAGFTHGMTPGWDIEQHLAEGDSFFFTFMGGDGKDIGRKTMQPIADFVDEVGDDPFFIWYGPELPHVPLNPPPEHRGHFEDGDYSESAKDYYGNIAWFDHTIGELLGILESRGELENTLIMYVNDNGWEQPPQVEYKGDTDLYSNGGMRGKASFFDTAFRSPILFHWPGQITPGRDDATLVNAIDLVPTALDFAGMESPDTLPGMSLKPVINGQAESGRENMIGYVMRHRADSSIYGEDLGPVDTVMGRQQPAYILRSQRYHFVWTPQSGDVILHDIVGDPWGDSNLAEDNPDLVSAYQDDIRQWAAEFRPGDTLP